MILGIILLVLVLGSRILNYYSKGTFFCKYLGWHKRPEKVDFDGISLNGRCPRCDKKVLQDSNGDWFAIGNQDENP